VSNQSTDLVRLLRFQVLNEQNGAISGEPDAIRLCGAAADEIEQLRQDLAIQTVNAKTVIDLQAEVERLRADVARHLAICTSLATENEQLLAQKIDSKLRTAVDVPPEVSK